MRKILNPVLICLLVTGVVLGTAVIMDRKTLNEGLIRFHVVANSDSEADQDIKLKVRDEILESLQADLEKIADVETARAYLSENLPKIQRIANETLQAAGFDYGAVVTLCREEFDTRVYDTFTLPAGVYDSLRITIGEGEGHNWWCVSFPTLCIPATTQGFEAAAVSAGFSETLCDTLTQKEGYEVRFYLLDGLGRLQNIFFQE